MIRQSHFWVYIQKNGKKSLEEVLVHSRHSSIIHNRQTVEACPSTDELIIYKIQYIQTME